MRHGTRICICALAAACVMNGQYRRGVNLAGAEFGNNHLPGTLGRDYTFNSEASFRYFAEKGLRLFRLPLQWERLQPALGGPLDDAYLANLKRDVAWARAHDSEVILDIHNFGRYSINEGGSLKTYVIDNPASDGTVKVTGAHLADLWVRLSTEFRFEPAVFAYDLMNEPHDMGRGDWKAISQAVLTAIRNNQDDKLILIPGDSWSSANRWATTHGPASWIQDPSNHFAYEAHQYFDRDESGTYVSTYDAELARTPDLVNLGRTRVSHFLDWCKTNGVRGIVDEYGIPYNDPRWAAVMENFLLALDEAGMDGAYWAAGEWWPANDLLSVQPAAGFTQDRPQLKTLQAHLGGGVLNAFSAASLSVARATGGALVTVYGRGFTDQAVKANAIPYPLALADVTVQVTDATGAAAMAGLLFAGPGQVNFQMPDTMAPGRASIAVLRGGTLVAGGTIQIAATAPAIFTANSLGYGLAAGQVIRVRADGSQTYESLVAFDAAVNAFVAVPVDFGAGDDRLFLALYGTGVRATSASLRIGSLDVTAQYAGPQRQYPGLDQVVAELPRSLAGAGAVQVVLKCDGVTANAAGLSFR